MKRLILSLSLLVLAGSLTGMEQPQPNQNTNTNNEQDQNNNLNKSDSNKQNKLLKFLDGFINSTSGFALGYLFNLGYIAVHEFGHKLTYGALTGNSSSIKINIFPPSGSTIPHGLNRENIQNWKGFSIAVAGPLFGICGALGSLKIANIINEKSKGKSTKNAIIAGLKKPFFNKQQPLWLRIAVGICLFSQIQDIVPMKIGYLENDGYKALDAIGKPIAVNEIIKNLIKK